MPEHLPELRPLLASATTAMLQAKVQRTHSTWKHTHTFSLVSCGLVDAYRVIIAFRPLADPHQKPVKQTSICSQWSE